MQMVEEKVEVCSEPLVKKCSDTTVGETVCENHYETVCETRYANAVTTVSSSWAYLIRTILTLSFSKKSYASSTVHPD
jgi:hypothetical protein